MAVGISLPFRTSRGRLVLDRGEVQMKKLINVAVQDGASQNPWNTDVGTRSPVFQGSTPVVKAQVRRDMTAHFRRWQEQERAEMIDLRFEERDSSSELVADLTYRDLETERVEKVSISKSGV
jgi:hypothetical protein